MSALLLDTHTWIWLLLGDQLKPKTIQAIEQAAYQQLLYLSAISVWELSMLVAKGRLQLHLSCSDWVSQALALPGLNLAPLLPAISIDSCSLPGVFHGDPADRLIVATARHYHASLLTRDARILAYAQSGALQAQAV